MMEFLSSHVHTPSLTQSVLASSPNKGGLRVTHLQFSSHVDWIGMDNDSSWNSHSLFLKEQKLNQHIIWILGP